MWDKCQRTPSDNECVQIKFQMEDLLRKCQTMAPPVAACGEVRSKYCVIWPRELYCFASPGGNPQVHHRRVSLLWQRRILSPLGRYSSTFVEQRSRLDAGKSTAIVSKHWRERGKICLALDSSGSERLETARRLLRLSSIGTEMSKSAKRDQNPLRRLFAKTCLGRGVSKLQSVSLRSFSEILAVLDRRRRTEGNSSPSKNKKPMLDLIEKTRPVASSISNGKTGKRSHDWFITKMKEVKKKCHTHRPSLQSFVSHPRWH